MAWGGNGWMGEEGLGSDAWGDGSGWAGIPSADTAFLAAESGIFLVTESGDFIVVE